MDDNEEEDEEVKESEEASPEEALGGTQYPASSTELVSGLVVDVLLQNQIVYVSSTMHKCGTQG
jgi:hypothetical protein